MPAGLEEFCRKIELEFEEIKPGSLEPDMNLRSTFVWNSINALILMAFVNSEYNVMITVEELQKCTTIRSLYDIVLTKEKVE